MRTLIGTSLGLLIGFVAGLIAMRYLAVADFALPQKAPKKEASKVELAATEKYFMCKGILNRELPLIIKSEGAVAKTLIFSSKTEADLYFIEKSNDMTYIARSPNPEAPEAFTTLEFNRVSAEMSQVLRRSNAAIEVLISICSNKIPRSECFERLNNTPGGSFVDCMSLGLDNFCPGLQRGNNFSNRFSYQCREVDRRF